MDFRLFNFRFYAIMHAAYGCFSSKALLLCLCAALTSVSATANGRPTLMVLGDSISAGHGIAPGQDWVALLERELNARDAGLRVINASIGGDTSGGALRRLPALLARHQPTLVVVEIGGNDGLRGYPVTQLRDNLAAIIRLCREHHAEVLLLGMRIPPNYGARYTELFHQSYIQVAAQLEVPLLPFLLDGIALQAPLMQADGIHPNTEAQPLILQNVLVHLEPLLD